MENSSRSKFIIEEELYRVILSLSIPLMVNNFIQTLYNLVDAFWVGKLGHVEFASTSFVWPVLMLFISIGVGISIAGTSIMSRLLGAGEAEKAGEVAVHLIYMSMGFALVFSVLGYVVSPWVVRFMGASGKFHALSTIYLQIDFLSFPFVMGFFAMQSILVSQGNTKAITLINALAAIANMVLDPFFIFDEFMGIPSLGLGVAGAAYATLISKVLLALVGVLVLYKGTSEIPLVFKGIKLKKKTFKDIISTALPSTLGQMGSSVGFIILNAAIASYGTVTLAAFGMINRATAIIMQPAMGIGGSLSAIVGQNIGARKMKRVVEALKKATVLTLLFTIAGSILYYIFDEQLVRLFISSSGEEEVIEEALVYLWYSLITVPFMGLFSIFQGFFQGTGFTSYGMYMDIGRLWLVRLPLIYVFKLFTDFGSNGIWFAMTFSNFIVIVFAWWLYHLGKWKPQPGVGL